MIGLTPNSGGGSSAPINQNNTPLYVWCGILDENTQEAYNEKLNAINITVSETQTPVYFQFAKKSGIESYLVYEIWGWKLGKGAYNPVGASALIENMVLLETNYPQLGDLAPIFETGTLIDLGEIETNLITYINSQVEFDLSDDEKIYYIQFIKDGVTQVYEYTGEPKVYGTSTVNIVEITDFDLIYSSLNSGSVSVTPSFQQTLNVSEIGDKVKFVNRLNFSSGSGVNGWINKTIPTDDNKFLIVGGFSSYNGHVANKIARLNSDASVDESFNSGTGFNASYLYDLAIDNSGKYIVAGQFTEYNGNSCNRIVRLNPDGSVDETFNIGTGFDSDVTSIAINKEDGKIIAVGNFTEYNGNFCNRIVRLNPDGSFDETFDTGTGFNGSMLKVFILGNGQIACGGTFTEYNGYEYGGFAILNPDGSFYEDIYLTLYPFDGGASGAIYDILQTSDGDIAVCGEFTSYVGLFNYFVKFHLDGSITLLDEISFDARVETITEHPDGKLLLGGNFTLFNGHSANKIIRITLGGFIDETFIGSANNVVHTIVPFRENYLVGGFFTLFNSTTANKLVLVDQNGNIISDFVEEKLTFNRNGNGIAEYFTNKAFEELADDELVPKKIIQALLPKEAIYYIRGQDETGFLNVKELKNNTTSAFYFVRNYLGGFSVPNFDPLKHIVKGYAYDNVPCTIQFNAREDVMKLETWQVGALSDYCFQFGGYIIIREIT